MDLTTTPDGPSRRELFLVEGVSAASTVRQAMNAQCQSVFALQGKILNAARASRARIEANPVCASLFAVLGCGVGSDCDPNRLSFSRVVFLTDPDVDGAHSRVLLATLFAHYLAPLISAGCVYAVIPPVARLTRAGGYTEYAYAEDDIARWRDASTTDDDRPVLPGGDLMRYRGVAQFSRDECAKLLLQPATRRQVRLSASARDRLSSVAKPSASY